MLLQETDIDTVPTFKDLLERLGISEGHQSPETSRSKGVCTLKFSDKFNIISNSRDDHRRRRIIETESKEGGQRYTIVNTYFPTKERETNKIYRRHENDATTLSPRGKYSLGGGGDFNIDEEEGTDIGGNHGFILT